MQQKNNIALVSHSDNIVSLAVKAVWRKERGVNEGMKEVINRFRFGRRGNNALKYLICNFVHI